MDNSWAPLIQSFLDLNKQINLSAIRDADGVFVKHIQDSLELNKIFDLNKGYVVADVGTGSGFPLLPLAITNPTSRFVGLESVRKKCDAVTYLAQQNRLSNVRMIRIRAEDYTQMQFDVVMARAVAYSDVLLDRTIHLVKPGWYLIFFKGYTQQEDADLKQFAQQDGLTFVSEHHYQLFEGDIPRVIYVLKNTLQ